MDYPKGRALENATSVRALALINAELVNILSLTLSAPVASNQGQG